MADKVTVWFDAEADYLEVRFSDAASYMKETKNDALMERVDAQGPDGSGIRVGVGSASRRTGRIHRQLRNSSRADGLKHGGVHATGAG